jgi:hypothetical protein
MKTAKQYFEELPEPIKYQALHYSKTSNIDACYPSLRSAILNNFDPKETEEGYVYWERIMKGSCSMNSRIGRSYWV